MAENVATVANDGIYWGFAKNGIIVLPDGRHIMIVPIGATTNFRVYQKAAGATTWTNVMTIAVSELAQSSNIRWGVEPSRDGSKIMLFYGTADRSWKCRLITVSGWTATAEQTLNNSNLGRVFFSMDASEAENGAWIFTAMYHTTGSTRAIGFNVAVRLANGNIVNPNGLNVSTNNVMAGAPADVAIELHKGGSTTNRSGVIAISWGTESIDYGINVYAFKFNETTGAVTTFTKVDGDIEKTGSIATWKDDMFIRRIRLQRVESTGIIMLGIIGPSFTTFGGPASGGTVGIGRPVGQQQKISAGTYRIKTTPTDTANYDPTTVDYCGSFNCGDYVSGHNRRIAVNFSYDENGVPMFIYMSPDASDADNGSIHVTTDRIPNFAAADPGVGALLASADEYDNALPWKTYDTMYGSKAVNGDNRRNPILFYSRSSDRLASGIVPLPSVVNILPGSGETISSSAPQISVRMPNRIWKYENPFYSITVETASDNAFTQQFQQYKSEYWYATKITTGTPLLEVTRKWTAAPIIPGTRYFRARVTDAYGNVSPYYTNANPVVISHLPVASSIVPALGEQPIARPYSDPNGLGYAVLTSTYRFSDPWAEDYQTAQRVTVWTEDRATQVWTSGKVMTAGLVASYRIPFAYRNVSLYVDVEVFDRFDSSGGVGPTATSWIIAYTPPTVDSLTPASVDGSTGKVNSNAPSFNFTTTPGLYESERIELVITKGGTTVWGGILSPYVEDGIFPVDRPVLQNNTQYSATLRVTDVNGLGGERTINFSTQWSPPAATNIVVSDANYNVANKGWMEVQWTNADQDPDLVMWNVYRRIDEIDPNTLAVVKTGPVELIQSLGNISPEYLFIDYDAPSGHKVNYMVRQVVDRFGTGTIIEGDSQIFTASFPVSDGYWLIDPTPEDPEASAFQLWNVVGDSYTEEYESNIVHLIGRGNHEDRGDRLGIVGSLDAKLRNSHGTTARQKKKRLETIREEGRSLYLRTPFGDRWYVTIQDLNIDRIAGVGLNEFVDVTIPYQEVYGGE